MPTLIGPLLGMIALRQRIWPGDGQDDAGLSRNAFYHLLAKDPTFPRVHIGGRVYYPEAEVRAWLAARMERPAAELRADDPPAPRRRGRPVRQASSGGEAATR